MYLCYLDESGTSEPRGNTAHFVYAGIAIPSDTWKEKDSQLSDIKGQFGIRDKEVHTGWILRRYHEQYQINDFEQLDWPDRVRQVEAIRLSILNRLSLQNNRRAIKNKKKYFHKTKAYIHLTYDERKSLILKLSETIRSWIDSRIFFYSIKKNYYDPQSSLFGGIYQDAFHQLVTRFEMFLVNKGRYDGNVLFGMLVSDNNETINTKLTRLMRIFYDDGAFWRDINNIIETPLFVDSKLTSMIQVADLISYVVRRFFDNGEHVLFDVIYPRIDRAGPALVGGRHYTPHESCRCRVCKGQLEAQLTLIRPNP